MSRRANPSALPLGTHGTYAKHVFKVPASVRAQATQGLALGRKVRDASFSDRTKVGVARAKQLVRGTVTLRDVVFMRAYFRRHAVDIEGTRLDRDKPTKGWVSWLRWGGTPGRWWVEELYAKHLGPLARKNPTPARAPAPKRMTAAELVKVAESLRELLDEWQMGEWDDWVARLDAAEASLRIFRPTKPVALYRWEANDGEEYFRPTSWASHYGDALVFSNDRDGQMVRATIKPKDIYVDLGLVNRVLKRAKRAPISGNYQSEVVVRPGSYRTRLV